MPLNDGYEPRGDTEVDILELLSNEDGRLAPSDVYDDLNINVGTGQHALYRLHAAGWIKRPRRGLYEFGYDPRVMSDEALADLYIEHAADLTDSKYVIDTVSRQPE